MDGESEREGGWGGGAASGIILLKSFGLKRVRISKILLYYIRGWIMLLKSFQKLYIV